MRQALFYHSNAHLAHVGTGCACKSNMAKRRSEKAFTRVELIVVLTVLVVAAVPISIALREANARSGSICCNCNLKQVGTAYRIWENDNGGHYPAETPQTNGGWAEILSQINAGAYAWTNYAIMANEMGQSPQVLVCPADVRDRAKNFTNIGNTNISYFIGVTSSDAYPQSILGGDRNLGPGTTPDLQYGYSPPNGRGNDVTINGTVCWSLKMHSRGNPAGRGNIMLGDGSAQQCTSAGLNRNWVTTNIPPVRWIFP
jgi:competence protein ComGC